MNNPNANFPNVMAAARVGAFHTQFVRHYRQQQAKVPPGWQQTVAPEERANLGLQFFTSYKLLKPELSDEDALRMSIQNETNTFNNSGSKEQYQQAMRQKMFQMQSLRQQHMQQGMQGQQNPNNPMGMVNPANLQPPRQNTPQQFPPGFPNPQLQRPMQPSPIPMTQSQSSLGINGVGTGNTAQGNQQPNMQPGQPGRLDGAVLIRLAQKLMQSASPEQVQAVQQEIAAWPEERRQQLQQRGINPILWRFRQQAEQLIKSGKIPPAQLAALQGAVQMNRPGGPMQQSGQPNQMQNQQLNMSQRQPNQDFDFNALANQQIEAIQVQNQGQQVVPASNNANGAQLGFPGQNVQPGQPPNAALAQRQALQNANLARQAQAQAARAQQMQQQQQAQQRNSNQMLQGQVGGLNMPPGAHHQGPITNMNMLNRPLNNIPGQAVPTTPQQRPQAHVPQMTPTNQGQVDPQLATQLMREARQRAAAAAAQGQPLSEQARLSMIPDQLAPEAKQQLLKLPEPQFRTILQNYVDLRRSNAMQNGLFQGGQLTPGQPNMLNPAQALQMNPLMNNNPMANLRQGMNMGQQTPGGLNAQMSLPPRPQLPVAQRFAGAQQVLQQNPGIIAITDNKPFPPSVLQSGIRQSVPPEIKTWAQLKQWASQNPTLMAGTDNQKLLLLQVMHFQELMRQQTLQQQQNGMAMGRPPQQMNMAGVPPPAQMTPGPLPARTPQQPGMPNMGPIQVTPQEIAMLRTKLGPGQSATDDQLRAYIYNNKMGQRRQQQQQMINQMQQRGQGLQPATSMPGMMPQGTRPQPTQTQPAQANAQPKPISQPHPPAHPSQPNQLSAPNNMNKGVKRPNDDSSDGNADVKSANIAPQAPAMVPSKSQPRHNLTQEQISKLTPAMRANLLQAQDASNKAQQQRPFPSQMELLIRIKDPARIKKYRMMLAEEDQKLPRGQPVQMSPDQRAHLQEHLKSQWPTIRKVEQALQLFLASYDGSEPDVMARSVMRARTLLLRQLNPADGTLHSELTATAEELEKNIGHVNTFVQRIMSRLGARPRDQASAPTQSQQQAHASPAQSQGAKQAQLNAANLKTLEKTLEEQSQRQPKAPPAPVSSQPPVRIGGQSPSGAPTYFEGAKTLTHLALPEKKRQKMDPSSQTSTPGPKASPRIGSGKGSSPELKRQPPPEKPAVQRPSFKCGEANCQFSARGFETQAELDAHVSQAHIPVDNPLQYVLDAVADLTEVDVKTGQPRAGPSAATRTTKQAPAPSRAVPQQAKPGQTPSMPQAASTPAGPQAAATPMTRIPTQPGIKSSPTTNLLRTPQTAGKVATPSTGPPAKATPASAAKTVRKEPEAQVEAEPEPEQEQELQPLLPVSLFDYSYEDIYSTLDAGAPFTTLDLNDEDNSWALRSRPSSPMTTPDSSSKDTPSTRQSDISENDNLQIKLDLKDADMPDAWLSALNGDPLPLDAQLSEDLQNLGVELPPLDSSDLMLFYPDSAMMDLESMDKAIESLSGTLDPSALTVAA